MNYDGSTIYATKTDGGIPGSIAEDGTGTPIFLIAKRHFTDNLTHTPGWVTVEGKVFEYVPESDLEHNFKYRLVAKTDEGFIIAYTAITEKGESLLALRDTISFPNHNGIVFVGGKPFKFQRFEESSVGALNIFTEIEAMDAKKVSESCG